MIKVVLDTNVFISALFWKGAPYQIFQKIITGAILNFISPQISEELREKLLDNEEYKGIKIVSPKEFVSKI